MARRPRSAGHALSEPRHRSNRPRRRRALPTDAILEELSWIDGPHVRAPRGARRWFPTPGTYGTLLCRETRALVARDKRPAGGNDLSGWHMPFPFEMRSGATCPICALGECGDDNCPTYRPLRPSVREALENLVVRRSLESLVSSPSDDNRRDARGLETYVSVGCGLLSQDWILIEKLRAAAVELTPSRVVLVDLGLALPVASCEGGTFPGNRSIDLRQMGCDGVLGPEFSFSALINFGGTACWGSRIFDFGGGSEDNIFVDVEPGPGSDPDNPGTLVFSVARKSNLRTLTVHGAWMAGIGDHSYLFTVDSSGTMRMHIDEELVATGAGHAPRVVERRHLFIGRWCDGTGHYFKGSIRKIKVWNECVGVNACEGLYVSEMEQAITQFTQWYAEDLSVWSFGSVASYAAAVAENPRFAADLLVCMDVHEAVEGFDDAVHQVLGPNGLALTLGGPGRSWRRRGDEIVEADPQGADPDLKGERSASDCARSGRQGRDVWAQSATPCRSFKGTRLREERYADEVCWPFAVGHTLGWPPGHRSRLLDASPTLKGAKASTSGTSRRTSRASADATTGGRSRSAGEAGHRSEPESADSGSGKGTNEGKERAGRAKSAGSGRRKVGRSGSRRIVRAASAARLANAAAAGARSSATPRQPNR